MRFYLPVPPRLPAIALLACIPLGGCATTTAGTATPEAPIRLLTADSLPALLLPAVEVGAAVGGADVVVTREVDAPWSDAAHFTGASDTGCLAVAGPAQQRVYADTGWSAIRGQVLREPPAAPVWAHFAVQAVVLFDTAEAASQFHLQSRRDWEGCSDRELRYAQQLAPDQIWSVGPVGSDGDVLTVSRSQRSPQQWFCQRALGVRGNAAVDVEACSSEGPTSAAAAIVRAIGERFPAA